MNSTAAFEAPPSGTVSPAILSSLEGVLADQGMDTVAARLAELRLWIDADMREVEAELRRFDRRETPLHKSAEHLIASEGKRLRPMCVVLAARLGQGFSPAVRDLGVAVELIHNATLLHDDVVDLGDKRRGIDAARVIYGNAASIFAGDWLLVEALRRVRCAGISELIDSVLEVLKRMLDAEALQLRNRGQVRASLADYFTVVEGKTASLFEWALRAGARAGGLDASSCEALATFGLRLGVVFQLVDDILDLSGDQSVVGKSLFSDLREGRMTCPLLYAVECEPGLGAVLQEACSFENTGPNPQAEREVLRALRETGALARARQLADEYSTAGLEQLDRLAPVPATDALRQMAIALVHRVK